MKLKSFQKVCSEVNVTYTVYKKGSIKSGEFKTLDYFRVDYLCHDEETLTEMILKRIDYENRGAEVVFVSANNATGGMSVSIEI